MKRTCLGLFLMTALMAMPSLAFAQGQPSSADKPAGDNKPAGTPAKPPEDDEDAETCDENPEQPKCKGQPPKSFICELNPEICKEPDWAKEAKRDVKAPMYAVQQLYALRVRRLEVNPYWSATLNDQFVSHPGPGLAINYYITNVLAVGVNGNLYAGLNQDSSFNKDHRRAARVAVPLTEYQFSAAANFTYVPVYGKFAGFGDFIFHYDAYIVSGLGVLSNRPIAVVDPDNRTFKNKLHLAFNAGIGLRIFFNRWFAAVLEVRDYIFFDDLENIEVPKTVEEARNEANWYGASKLTNHVQAQLGFSVFLPFSWEYRLPK
jgi:outer membrane beta-barrel protein